MNDEIDTKLNAGRCPKCESTVKANLMMRSGSDGMAWWRYRCNCGFECERQEPISEAG